VIILDQFEEFFIFWQQREHRQPFIAALADCYDDRSLNVRIIIALRKDYYSDLADFQEHIPTIFHNEYRLTTMTRQDAQAAITMPVAKLGRQVTYEQEVLNTLLDDLVRGGSELPHLQIICTRLYEALDVGRSEITLALYDEMGRAEGILGDYLDDVLDRLPRNGGVIAQQILEELVSVEGTKRVLDYESLVARLEAEQDEVDDVLIRLVDARLLRRDESDGQVIYEMAHEYLIGEISLSPDVKDRKKAEELLYQGVANWERYDTLLSPEAFTLIDAQRERLRMDEKAQELMLRTALRHGMSVGTWLTRMTDTDRSLTLAQRTLCEKQGEPARRSLNTTAGDIQPERLQALAKRLTEHWYKTRGSDRAPTSDALWALRRHLPRRLHWRLALSRSPRLVRRAALPIGGGFIVLVLVAAIQWGPRYWIPKPSIDWVDVPEGEFLMGSYQRSDVLVKPDAIPQHIVELDTFRVGRYEITNAQYAQCVRAKVCAEPGEVTNYRDPVYADHPVVYVSWDDARSFCHWMGGRLPTEAEWEKAARGTDGRIYPWGNSPPDCTKANYADCGLDTGTAAVGSHAAGASPYGVQDMAGNVWEWVNDWYSDKYYDRSPARNPPGGHSNVKVMRGGGHYYDETSIPAFNRSYGPPSERDTGLGFRCIMSKVSVP
jgi:formylglycine-generating enzyme required for sulfatase activity